jgi:hypothetical protein
MNKPKSSDAIGLTTDPDSPLVYVEVSELSMSTSSPAGPSRTAPPRHNPSIIFAGSSGAFPSPSRARKVR